MSRGLGPDEVVRLRHRREFLAAAKGQRVSRDPFLLQCVGRDEPERARVVGIGLTVTKKIGNAVVRNRARRRLREALRLTSPGPARAAHDYVVLARAPALTRPFAQLQDDLVGALAQMSLRLDRHRP